MTFTQENNKDSSRDLSPATGSALEGRKPSEVLEAAAALIEPEGAWTRGAFARAPSGEARSSVEADAVCWCMDGALIRASGSRDDYWGATRALMCSSEQIAALGWIEWNDAPGRTQAEVVEALRKAAELARSEGR